MHRTQIRKFGEIVSQRLLSAFLQSLWPAMACSERQNRGARRPPKPVRIQHNRIIWVDPEWCLPRLTAIIAVGTAKLERISNNDPLPFFVRRYRKPANDIDDTLYMRVDFPPEPMSVAELARTSCVDCRWDTLPHRASEYYMVHDSVWKTAGMEPDGGCLCIGCLEERLGRMLTPDDFTDCILNDLNKSDGCASSRLRKRLTRYAT